MASSAVELARPTLDTLPLNIAVVDQTGEILMTNRAWKEFAVGESDAEEPEEIGGNYLAATDATDDSYAAEAAEGLQAVLAGEQDLFKLEYPCHSPTEQRWFLMRVSPFELDGDRHAVVAHLDITDRKLAEIAADERAEQLSHVLDRVNGLVGDVTEAIVHSRSRGEVERAACERFTETDPYAFAWVGRPDLRSDSLVPSEWAGDAPDDFADRSLSLDSTEDPAVIAYETGETQMVSDLSNVDHVLDPGERWDAVALAAIPLSYRSKRYGVLTVYADQTDLFDARERAVLNALGRAVATAIHALTTGRVLSSASVIQVDLAIQDPDDYLAALTAGTDATVTYHDSMVDDDGDLIAYATVENSTPEAVRELADDHPDVLGVEVLTNHQGTMLLEAVLSDSIVSSAADHDGLVQSLSAADGTLRTAIAFPDEEAARAAFEHFRETHQSVELTAYREREREMDTESGFRASIEPALTQRQLTALRTAYLSGYFEWPRPISGDEVAESMDITRATFHQHLREAQRKLAAAFFDVSTS